MSRDSVAEASQCRGARNPDWTFRALVTLLLAVGIWLLAMPWVPALARCTMNRFHLKTRSFATWVIQQPIPPMYSFANTTEVRTTPPSKVENESSVIAGRMINHFPTREFTFANARVRYLLDDQSKWFVLRSRYRGQSVESVYRLDRAAEKGWTATLIDPEDGRGEDGT